MVQGEAWVGIRAREAKTMRKSKLPQEIIDVMVKHGLAGRRVYVPKLPDAPEQSRNLVTIHLPKLLAEVESDYERRGVTFFSEGSPRKLFSGNYGKTRIGARFNLKPRTAASVSSAAWKRWREWFSRSERLRHDELRDLADEARREFAAMYFTYLEIRQRLRAGEAVGLEEYMRYHNAPEALMERVKDLAQASIQSCPWRPS
jgi:hypothetical protein